VAEDNILHNEELFLRLNEHATRSALQFSLQGKDRPSLGPDAIWTINLIIHNAYLQGALGYLGAHTLDKITDGVIGALLTRLVAVGGKLLGHVRHPAPEPVPPQVEKEVDALTDAFRSLLIAAEDERAKHALAGGQRESADILSREFKLPRDKAETIAHEYGAEIERWLR
jgi:hypothetical protein